MQKFIRAAALGGTSLLSEKFAGFKEIQDGKLPVTVTVTPSRNRPASPVESAASATPDCRVCFREAFNERPQCQLVAS